MSTPPPQLSGHEQTWQATRAEVAPTQVQPREEDDGPPGLRDIGRPISPTTRELFVSCDPGEALQQQFDHLQPEFVALHDLGTSASRKLLASVAAASQRAVQKLVVRRQGYGTPLATLEFVDFPTGDRSLRLYTTECDADTQARHEIARVLLSYSRLGVVMIGDLPPHLLASTLQPLHDAMMQRDWHNRHMLLLPLSASTAMGNTSTELARGTGVTVRTTPQVTRQADAWAFISGTWNRLREQVGRETEHGLPPLPGAHSRPGPLGPPIAPPRADVRPPPATATHTPLAMTPMPATRPMASAAPADHGPLNRYVQQLIELPGMVSVAVFDLQRGQALLHAGARPEGADLARHGATLLAAMSQTSKALGMGHLLPEAAITLGTHHLVLRGVPHHPGLALHAVLDKTHANLTLARLQIGRLDALLDTPA